MHLSRPSACRWSTGRPWSRGAVGRFSSGYSSVTTFLNIVLKVTPKPATGATKSFSPPGRSASGRSLRWGSPPFSFLGARSGPLTGHLLYRGGVVVHRGRSGEYGYWVTAARRRQPIGSQHGLLCLLHLLVVSDERDSQHDQGKRDADVGDGLEPAVTGVGELAERSDDHDPDQAGRDQHLPAQLHELVVTQPRQCAAQPDVEEQQ